MDSKEIAEVIATKVWGWIRKPGYGVRNDGAWVAKGLTECGEFRYWLSDYNPAENDTQAREAAEALRLRDPENNYWDIVSPFKVPSYSAHDKSHLFCGGFRLGDVQGRVHAETPALALCGAMVQAVMEEGNE